MFGTDGAEVEIVAGGNLGGAAFNLVRDGGCIEVDIVVGTQGKDAVCAAVVRPACISTGYADLCHAVDDGIAVALITGGLGCTVKIDILRLGSQQPACLYLPAVYIDTFFSF